ncbi:hypothetical protein ACWDOP_00110 [Nocardia sp. NPDC003693]
MTASHDAATAAWNSLSPASVGPLKQLLAEFGFPPTGTAADLSPGQAQALTALADALASDTPDHPPLSPAGPVPDSAVLDDPPAGGAPPTSP